MQMLIKKTVLHFIKILSELSDAYNPHPNGCLFYHLDRTGNVVLLKDQTLFCLPELLGLLAGKIEFIQ